MQARKLPCLVRFSTMNGAPHFGHGSAIGSCGVVKSQSGIAAAAVENAAAPASSRGAAADEFAFVALRALDAQRDRARVLALRIFLAADEFAEAAVPPQQLPLPHVGHFSSSGTSGCVRFLRACHQPPRGLAIRIAGAREEQCRSGRA